MTDGEVLGRVLLSLATMVHSVLDNWVGVTTVTTSSGTNLSFSVLPEGIEFADWTANTLEQWAVLLDRLVHLPMMVGDLVNMIVAVLS